MDKSIAFVLAMLASMLVLVSKGGMIQTMTMISTAPGTDDIEMFRTFSVTFAILFLPELLLSVYSVNSIRTVYLQPSLLLLPLFTFFTFSRVSFGWQAPPDNRIKFSQKMTFLNMALAMVGFFGWN